MNTEFNKISMLDIASFDFASFDFASFDRLRTNGINQSIPNLDKPQDKYLHKIIFCKMHRKLFLRY